MKKLITAMSLLLIAGVTQAQVRTTTPPTTTGSGQSYPATTTSPGTNTMGNNGNNPANGTAPTSTYPGTTTTPYPGRTTTYPGTTTTPGRMNTQPGMTSPGTGTMPGSTTTPGRTYSDRNNLINNSPNTTPASPNPAVGNPTINGR